MLVRGRDHHLASGNEYPPDLGEHRLRAGEVLDDLGAHHPSDTTLSDRQVTNIG